MAARTVSEFAGWKKTPAKTYESDPDYFGGDPTTEMEGSIQSYPKLEATFRDRVVKPVKSALTGNRMDLRSFTNKKTAPAPAPSYSGPTYRKPSTNITSGGPTRTYRASPGSSDPARTKMNLDRLALEYGMERPEYDIPDYDAPEYDDRRVAAIRQKISSSGVRRLRQTVRAASGKSYSNPNVKRMILRDALAGYGTGLENLMSGAYSTARDEYARERSEEIEAVKLSYQNELAEYEREFEDSMSEFYAEVQTRQQKEAMQGIFT